MKSHTHIYRRTSSTSLQTKTRTHTHHPIQSQTTIKMRFANFLPILVLSALPATNAGAIGYAICQSGCAGLVTVCYAGAGAVFGAVAAVAAPPAILACNSAFGACSAK